jgi:alpha-amylase
VVQVNPDNRNEEISGPFEIEAFTKFTFPGRKKKYSSFEWNYMCFTSVDYAYNLSEDRIVKIINGNGDGWKEKIDK